MPRPATGQVLTPKRKDGTRIFAIRFSAYGERRYITLGMATEGWTRQRAEDELANVLAEVRLGVWRANGRREMEARTDPTLHEFATDWLKQRTPELRATTVKDYEWALSYHLLPAFVGLRLSEIGIRDIDRYKATKLEEGRIAAAQINRTLRILAQILDVAVEYGHMESNPARGRRRRLKTTKPVRTVVEPEQLMVLLSAANSARPVLATLAGAGLRVGEAMALDWRDVNLATGILTVQESKTAAGAGREIDLPGGLLDELKAHKAQSPRTEADDPVFVTKPYRGTIRRQCAANVRHSLKVAIRGANVALSELGIAPISEQVSPHSLRRTYASLRAVLRDDPVYIAEQLGHEDPTFTFRVYARAVKRWERLPANYREAFDRALEWAVIGSSDVESLVPSSQAALASHVQR